MNERDRIGMIGAGGQADETESYLQGKKEVLFRAVSSEYASDGLIAMDHLTTEQVESGVIAAVGAPGMKKKLIDEWPGEIFTSSVSEYAILDTSAEVGEGSIIGHGAIITTNVEIGRHVLVNIGTTVSHNVKIGNFSTVSPGVRIGGNVTIGEGTFVGIGAIISNGVNIAEGSVIGAGTVVLNDVETPNSVMVGSPARLIRINEGWLDAI